MTVLEVKETACAPADEKQRKWKKKGKRGREEKGGRSVKGRGPTCCHLFAGSLTESAAACSHRESF